MTSFIKKFKGSGISILIKSFRNRKSNTFLLYQILLFQHGVCYLVGDNIEYTYIE